jgi:aminoglycoside phosphotransferase
MAITSLTLLLGPHAKGALTAGLRECGAGVDHVRLADVRVQPCGAVRVRYLADLRRSDGSRTRETLVAATGESIPAGATVVAGEYCGEPVEVGMWRFTRDPALPALRILEDPVRLADFFYAHGLGLAGRPTVVVRAYRPTQRAVLEVSDGRTRWFVKVVEPTAVAPLWMRHDVLAARLPVPPVLAETSDGIVVLPEATGMLLRDRLIGDAAPGSAELPAPEELEQLLDALPEDLMRMPSRRSMLQRVRDSARVLRICAESDPAVPATLAAELASEATRLVDQVLTASPQPAETRVPVHGDFYHNQLLSDGSQVTGVLDVDTAGPGERADEWATLIAYLSVLGISHAQARRYCDEVHTYAERRIDPRDLHRRTAAVVLGLVTAPFRARLADWPRYAAGRLALAREWLQME